jgi:hypothetical protein
VQRRAREAARNETAPVIGHARSDALGLLPALEGRKDTTAGARHARRDRPALRVELPAEPIERLGDHRIACPDYWLAYVAGTGGHCRHPLEGRKAAYCDNGRISCQFRRLEDLCRAHGDLRVHHQIPACRQLHSGQLLTSPLTPGAVPLDEHRHVGSERQSQRRQGVEREAGAPQMIQGHQHSGRIRAASPQATARRDVLENADVGAELQVAVLLQQTCRSHRQIVFRGHLRESAVPFDATVLAHREPDAIAAINQLKERL